VCCVLRGQGAKPRPVSRRGSHAQQVAHFSERRVFRLSRGASLRITHGLTLDGLRDVDILLRHGPPSCVRIHRTGARTARPGVAPSTMRPPETTSTPATNTWAIPSGGSDCC
jgi:hypothetical protein